MKHQFLWGILVGTLLTMGAYLTYEKVEAPTEPAGVACTMDARLCPDGSSVGRVGPSCDFAPCPPIQKLDDLVRLESPKIGDAISSPLVVQGTARGTWFFEGSFPVVLKASDGTPIAKGPAQASGEWMTTEFVPFTATLTFLVPEGISEGTLVLEKDNPSGLPENADQRSYPIRFKSAP